jgi:hypothetical protein
LSDLSAFGLARQLVLMKRKIFDLGTGSETGFVITDGSLVVLLWFWGYD